MDKLLSMDFHEMIGRLTDVVRDPSSNPKIAVLLLAIVTLLVVILLLAAIMFIMSRPDDEEWEEEWEGEGRPFDETVEEVPARPRSLLNTLAVVLGVGVLIWVATGVVTAQSSLCTSCHAGNPHAQAKDADPHASLSCVACHEPGGAIGSVTYMVPPRTIHFVSGIISTKVKDDYSRAVPSSSCAGCHSAEIAKTLTVEAQGVRISHAEPLAAGAKCVDCHALSEGIVSNRTVGMTPCLRCHDGRAAASECGACHTKDIANAVRPSAETTVAGQDLIETPDCYACHTPKTCDSCHGIRMPHTKDFILHGHARAAAMDFWYGSGQTCFKCHTADHNPCTKCHASAMPSHGPGKGWAVQHQYGDPKSCSTACHAIRPGGETRTMCEFCHDSSIKPRKPAPSTTATQVGG
jgi:hypothetical protein